MSSFKHDLWTKRTGKHIENDADANSFNSEDGEEDVGKKEK